MSGLRRVLVGFVAAAVVLSGVPAPAAWGVSPAAPAGQQVPTGMSTSIGLDGDRGAVTFPVNAHRGEPIWVDVAQRAASGAEVAAAAAAGERFLGDVVTVTARDATGAAVTSVPHQVVLGSAGRDARAVVKDVVPGVRVTVEVDAADVAGRSPNDVALYTRSGPGTGWTRLPSAFDPVTGIVTGHSDHLSQFAVLAAGSPAAAAAVAAGPTVVLDPDDNVGSAQFPGEPLMTELAQNLKLTDLLTTRLVAACQANVVVTRGSDPFVDHGLRAQVATNAAPDLMATLAFNALGQVDADGNPIPGAPGTPWGTESEGGVRAWASTAAGIGFAQRFLDAVPQYTGRPAPTPVNGSAGAVPLPYPTLAAVDTTYAHVELLFMDHIFDHAVIRDRFDLVVDAAAAAMIGQLKAQGFACSGAGDNGLPRRPSAGELAQLRDLGWSGYQLYGADPVSFTSGNYLTDEPVFTLPGLGDQVIDVNLTYNSQDGRDSNVGVGWSFAYNVAYQQYADGGALVRFDDGRSLVFDPGPGGTFVSPPSSNATLRRTGDGRVELTTNHTMTYRFAVDTGTGAGVLDSITDRQGNTTTLTWGAAVGPNNLHPLQRIVDEAGQTVTLTSTADGRIASVTHPDGRVWAFTYANDRLATLTDARGAKRSFSYTSNGFLHTITAGDGVGYVTNSYDDKGRVTSQTNATGDVRRFAYQDKRTEYTDALGNTTTYLYDDKGQVTQALNAVGDAAKTEYDRDSNPVTVIDEAGRVTRTEYDGQGRPLKVTDRLGHVSANVYNPSGDLVRMEQPDGLGGVRTTTFEVDARGRTTKTTFDDGSTQTATFDSHGDRTSVTDQNGNTTRFGIDARGNTVASTDALGHRATATFDLANRQLTLTDENGHTTTYDYDRADNLVSVTDPLGHRTTYGYDVNNTRTSTTDALDRTTSYSYDKNLNLVGVTHPDGSMERYTLDGEYGVTASVDGRGGTVATTYDALLRPAVSLDENGQRWTTAYDAVGNPVRVTDPTGVEVALGYDALDRVVSRTDQNGHTRTTTYDAAGNRVRDTAADGTSINAEYDALGQLTAVRDEQGQRATATYDPAGNVATRTDRRGNTFAMAYDALNRVVRNTNPDGGVSTRRYDPAGNVVAVTDPRGGTVQTGYDAADRAVRNTDALGAVTATQYDAVGNVVRTTDAEGLLWRMEYDAMNRLTAKVSPLGDRDGYRYDANGNQIATIRPDGVVTERVYDARDDLLTVIENSRPGAPPSADVNVTTSYVRNPVGWVVAMVDAKGSRTAYDVDGLGQVTRSSDPLGRSTSRTYSVVDTVASRTDANGRTTTYAYAPDRQLTAVAYPDGTRTTYGYDADNYRTAMTDSVGTTSWTRDWRGNETSSTDATGNTVAHGYDLNGNVTTLAYSQGFRSLRSHDAANRLATVTDPSGTISYTRDRLGRPVGIAHPGGVRTTLGYDAEGNTTAIEHDGPKANPTATLLHLAYTYTADNLVATRTLTTRNGKDTGKPADPGNNGPDLTTYSYDALNRLTGSVIAGGNEASYGYDPVGNRVSHTASDDPQSPSPRDALQVAYSYDAADQLLTETRSSKNAAKVVTRGYDRNGNVITATTQRLNPNGKPVGRPDVVGYRYNPRDELTAAGTWTWTRDGLGRPLTSTDGKDTTGYVHDGPRVIETLGTDAGTFVRGDSTGLLSQTVGNNPVTEVVLADLLGTVLGVARPNGISSKIATMTDFGEYVGNQHPAGIFGFTGELQDAATSRTDFLARSYDPASARFLQRDRGWPDLTTPMTWQPYLYAFAAPTTYADYLGAFGWSDVGKIAVSVAVGVAVTAAIVATAPVSVPALLVTAAAVTAGGVASGIAYRAVDGQSASQIFNPKSIAIDAGIGLVTLGAGKILGPALRTTAGKVATTKVAQSVATSQTAKIAAAQAARARTIARAVQQRAADSAANARTAASNVRTTTTANIRTGVSTMRSRTTSPRSGRATASEPATGSTDRSGVTTLQPLLTPTAADDAAVTLQGRAAGSTTGFGSGSGPWAEGVAARSGGATAQLTKGSCVAACGAMLSGRPQGELLANLGEWSHPQALARELGEGWTGGFFGSADDAIAAASRGSMGATLQAGTGPGHMVVISPLGDGRFLVRDPWAGGSTYEVGSDWIGQYVSGGVFR